MENNYTNEHPDISHIPNGMEQIINRAKNMSHDEWDKEFKRIQRDQMAVEEAVRREMKNHGWDGVPLREKVEKIIGSEWEEAVEELHSAKTDEEYKTARARVVYLNKLREGGADPNNPFAYPNTEWRVLCALCDDKAWAEYGYQFNEGMFTDPKRVKVYNAIKAVAEDGKPLDLFLIFEKLGYGVDVEWMEWLMSDTCQTYCLPYWLKELKLLQKKREYADMFKDGEMGLHSGDMTIDSLNEKLRQVMEDSPVEEVATLGDALNEVKQVVEKNREAVAVGTHTGFRELDMVGGLQGGDLIILAGDTSSGKTSLALSITLNTIIEKNIIAYYSMEMPKRRLGARLVAMYPGVTLSSSHILRNRMSDNDCDQLNKVIAIMPQTELLFDDKATIKFDDLLGSIRMMAKKYNVKGAIIDYLQILNVTNNRGRDTQEQMMAQVARRLKNVAMECNIWVMAISQLNRDKNKPEPTLARLRDSGQIAEAADIVMLIYRPELYGLPYAGEFANKSTKDTAQIDIAKGRDIGTKKFLVGFKPECTYFYSIHKDDIPNVVAPPPSPTGNKRKPTPPQAPEPDNDLPF